MVQTMGLSGYEPVKDRSCRRTSFQTLDPPGVPTKPIKLNQSSEGTCWYTGIGTRVVT